MFEDKFHLSENVSEMFHLIKSENKDVKHLMNWGKYKACLY